jgi:hypothetical protein
MAQSLNLNNVTISIMHTEIVERLQLTLETPLVG